MSQLIRTKRIFIITSFLILQTLPVTGNLKKSFYHHLLSNGSVTDYVWSMVYQSSSHGLIVTEKSALIILDVQLTATQSVMRLTGGLQGIRKILRSCFGSWRKKSIRSSGGRILQSREKDQKRFICFTSLGEGYRPDDLEKIISGEMERDPEIRKQNAKLEKKVDMLTDIQAKLDQGKGAGYARWAKVFNV